MKTRPMKIGLIVPALIASGLALPLSFANAGELTVRITDIRATKGALLVSVVKSEAGWKNQEKPVAAEKHAVDGKEAVLKFDLPAGSYAVQVLHDENDNGELDFNAVGMPTEGYGFSNNPQVMRRAEFSEAKFDVTEAASSIVVQLR